MVLNFDFESRLTLHAKQGKIKLTFFYNLSQKTWLFINNTKHRQITYQIEARKETSWYVLGDDRGERNGQSKSQFPLVFISGHFFGDPPTTKGWIMPSITWGVWICPVLTGRGPISSQSHSKSSKGAAGSRRVISPTVAAREPPAWGLGFRDPSSLLRRCVWLTELLTAVNGKCRLGCWWMRESIREEESGEEEEDEVAEGSWTLGRPSMGNLNVFLKF